MTAADPARRLTAELAVDPVPAVRGALGAAAEARMSCEKTLAGARETVEAAADALRTLEEERLKIENSIAPLRERINELRLKEQAAQINHDQYEMQLHDASADEARLSSESENAPRLMPRLKG